MQIGRFLAVLAVVALGGAAFAAQGPLATEKIPAADPLFGPHAVDPYRSPMNSRKMTARLQADTSSHRPILLIQNAGAGHGIGASYEQRIDQPTDLYTFFASQLGA